MKTHSKFKITRRPKVKKPYLVIDHDLLQKVRYMVHTHPIECQWYHRVTRSVTDEGNPLYTISDFFVPPQIVSGGEVESDGTEVEQMWRLLQEERELSLPELGEIMANTSCWCHSHHNMGVGPSGQDNHQWKKQLELAVRGGQESVQMMMIFNKRDEYFSRAFDPELNHEFENLDLIVVNEPEYPDVDRLMTERFTKRKPKPKKPKVQKTTQHGDRLVFPNGHPKRQGQHRARASTKPHGRQKTIDLRSGDQGKAPAPNSLKTETEDSFSVEDLGGLSLARELQVEPNDFQDLTKLTEALNRTEDPRVKETEALKIINKMDQLIDPDEYPVISTLLWGNINEIRDLEDHEFEPVDLEEEEDLKTSFTEALQQNKIHRPAALPQAINCCWILSLCDSPEMAEPIVDAWLQFVNTGVWPIPTITLDEDPSDQPRGL